MRIRPSIVLLSIALAGCGGAASPGGSHVEPPGGSCVEPAKVQKLQDALVAKNGESLASAVARALGTPGYERITPAVVHEFIPGLSPENPRSDRPPPTVLAKSPERGLLSEEAIVATPAAENAPSKIVFGTTACSAGSSCGCSLRPEYHFASAPGGRVVILRLNPQIHSDDKVLQCGPCGFGCGMPSPPPIPTSYVLPVDDVSKVEIIDVPYEWHRLHVDCEKMIPAP
ncbi:hypothetical protein [Polyangium sp. 6x1]|uniref:hypothetical protein n=1 Tax=Polyangium sp. 6x1 TaxID=3042689 RepID=UPI002482751C|nr:hypothetical protein [Polyangium sp. 6x1]MDI1451332.1 hypothetical protein [Polyangium sp. 6x1]